MIDEGDVGDADDGLVGVFVEVESALLQPLEIRRLFYVKTTLERKKAEMAIIELTAEMARMAMVPGWQ